MQAARSPAPPAAAARPPTHPPTAPSLLPGTKHAKPQDGQHRSAHKQQQLADEELARRLHEELNALPRAGRRSAGTTPLAAPACAAAGDPSPRQPAGGAEAQDAPDSEDPSQPRKLAHKRSGLDRELMLLTTDMVERQLLPAGPHRAQAAQQQPAAKAADAAAPQEHRHKRSGLDRELMLLTTDMVERQLLPAGPHRAQAAPQQKPADAAAGQEHKPPVNRLLTAAHLMVSTLCSSHAAPAQAAGCGRRPAPCKPALPPPHRCWRRVGMPVAVTSQQAAAFGLATGGGCMPLHAVVCPPACRSLPAAATPTASPASSAPPAALTWTPRPTTRPPRGCSAPAA